MILLPRLCFRNSEIFLCHYGFIWYHNTFFWISNEYEN